MNIRNVLTRGAATCAHLPDEPAAPTADRCEECGSTRNLRMCASCGHVGCCESQRGDARAHALAAGHPVVIAMPVASGFRWCFEENAYV
ncbi:MAG TPA: UBP-type zinc finger domain-containing protein [Candidatus Limnocylindrales bacterium]|nr:UBP-type zinc finger domain-containing protein [Candidatus Limnocylindrales bacterium]